MPRPIKGSANSSAAGSATCWRCEGPGDHVAQAGPISMNELGALCRQAVLLDFVCDNQLAIPEIGDPQVVSGAAKQGIRDFILECQVPLLEIAHVGVVRHGRSPNLPVRSQTDAPRNDLERWTRSSLGACNAARDRLL